MFEWQMHQHKQLPTSDANTEIKQQKGSGPTTYDGPSHFVLILVYRAQG